MYKKTWLGLLLFLVSVLSGCASSVSPSGKTLNWATNYANGLESARKYGRPIMMFCITSHCRECQDINRYVFYDAEIVKALTPFINIHVNVENDKKLRNRFAIREVPTILFLDQRGKKIVESERWRDKVEFLDEIRDIYSRYGR